MADSISKSESIEYVLCGDYGVVLCAMSVNDDAVSVGVDLYGQSIDRPACHIKIMYCILSEMLLSTQISICPKGDTIPMITSIRTIWNASPFDQTIATNTLEIPLSYATVRCF